MEVETALLPSNSQPSSPPSSPSSSSSSSRPRKKYDVFLNFQGEDTMNFIGHLRAALYSEGIETFIDEDDGQLGRDGYISSQPLQAIEDSKCSIIILSESYASSTCCLDELDKIIDYMKNKGQIVIPIFYHVSPSNVRNQTGNFGAAFAKHEENLRDDIERLNCWRDALNQVAGVAGLDVQNYRDEADFIRDIVEEVSRKKVSPFVASSAKIPNKDNHRIVATLYSCAYSTLSLVIIFLVFFLVLVPLIILFVCKIASPVIKKLFGFDLFRDIDWK